jgi:hypothetical protein
VLAPAPTRYIVSIDFIISVGRRPLLAFFIPQSQLHHDRIDRRSSGFASERDLLDKHLREVIARIRQHRDCATCNRVPHQFRIRRIRYVFSGGCGRGVEIPLMGSECVVVA